MGGPANPWVGYKLTPPPEACQESSEQLRYVKVTRTNDDIVEKPVRDLVNCSEHERKDGMMEATDRKLLFILRMMGARLDN